MIPEHELTQLSLDMAAALNLATEGRADCGYNLLDLCLMVAETEAPEPWAPELADLYRAALVHFAQEQGIRFESSQEVLPPVPLDRVLPRVSRPTG